MWELKTEDYQQVIPSVQAIIGHADFSTTADYYTAHSAAYLAGEMKKFKGIVEE